VYSNNSCTAALQGAGVKTVTNAIVPNSDSLLFNNAGTFYWKAVYAGDANNAPATSTCLALTVAATSTAPTSSAMISGTVYNDADKDTTRDAGEVGVAGFTVKLYQGAGWWANGSAYKTTTTDSSGFYSFGTLGNGTYSIELINMAPWHQDTGDYNSVAIANQVSLTDKNFAVSTTSSTTTPPSATTTPASIGGKVYNDLDGDKKLDGSEPGIAGFTVNLYKGANFKGQGKGGVFQSAVTDANGMYLFANLADGKYSVELINKAGWHQDTGDYKNLKIKKGVALPNTNFANSSSTPHTNEDDDDNYRKNELKKWLQSKGWWGWWNSR